MSGPVQRPLKVEESDKSVQVQPCTTISFNAADFTVSKTSQVATISIDSTGTGASLTDTYIGFGNASNLLTGSANFTFVDESGGSGPTVLLTGDKPIIKIQDDSDPTDYYTEWQQSGASFYWFSKDSGSTNKEMIRVSSGYVYFNDDGEDIDIKMEGANVDNLFYLDAGLDNIGIATVANTNTRLHISDDGSKANTVRIESTDNDTAVGPVLDMRRNNADGTSVAGDKLGVIQFTGLDTGGGAETYNRLVCEIKDPDTTQAVGRMKFMGLDDGSELEYMRYEASAVVFNELGVNIDFRIEGQNDGSLFRTDASDDSVAIGSVPDTNTAKLQVTDDGTKSYTVLLESTDPDANQGPVLALWRNSPSPVSGDDIGAILFAGENDGGGRVNFARIRADMDDVTAGGEDCSINFQLEKASSLRNNFRIRHSEVVVNEDSVDTNFRVESDGNTNMFMVDAGLNLVSVGASPVSGGATFQVPDNTISSYCNVKAVRSDATATMVFLNADCQGQTWVNDSATAWALDLPESPVKGMHFRFVSTNGDMTVDPNPSGGTSNTINGGTGALSRNVDNQLYDVICIDSNKWILNNP